MSALKWLAIFALGLPCAACREERASPATTSARSSASQSAGVNVKRPIELFSWWARVGESDALGALTRLHGQRFPGDEILNASAEGSGLARRTLAQRMAHGQPPDTFQANIGQDLMRWVVVNGLDSRESRLLPLDDVLPDVAEWRRVIPATVIEALSYDGKMYAVPSNLHRLNVVYFNKKVFAEHHVPLPTSIADLERAGEVLRAAGVDLFAVGSRDPWTLSLFVFECLLVAREGPDFYQDYFRGRLQPDDPRIVATLRHALRLMQWANRDQRQLSWLQALDLVSRGRAAVAVMGDWARVSLNASGLKIGADYGELAFPGSATTFVYTSDTFPLPVAARNSEGARRLLSTIGSREGQRALSVAKSALPARVDVELDDAVLTDKAQLLQTGRLVFALSGAVPAQFAEDLNTALAEMIDQQDVEPVVQTLRTRYALLK